MTPVTTVRTCDDVAIAVHDFGGVGRRAVLVHATGFHAEVLAPLAMGLAGELGSWAPDLRGHGVSEAPSGHDFSWEGFAADVLATTDMLASMPEPGNAGSSGRPYGIGHSLGATALLLAEAERPGSFAAIYAYEPILIPQSRRRPFGTPNPLSTAARKRRAEFGSRAEALERYRSRPPLSLLAPEVLERYVQHGFEDLPDGSVRLRCRPEDEALVFEAGFASDAAERLDEVRCPVILVAGARSEDLGRAGAELALGRLRSGRAVELPGLGHLGPLEAPLAVAASVHEAFGAAGS